MKRNIHLSGIRQLTRHLDKVFDDIHDEIVQRCKYQFTTKPKQAKRWWRRASTQRVDLATDEWAEGNAYKVFFDLVNHFNQRTFVGLPLGPCFQPHCGKKTDLPQPMTKCGWRMHPISPLTLQYEG
jgi:hypothetical protein